MFGYIYKTTNLLNNKIYIGQKRGNFNKNYHGSGKVLRVAINKYGIKNFNVEVLCECNDEMELNEKEKYFIAKFKSLVKYGNYNITEGGHGAMDLKERHMKNIMEKIRQLR